ncbi:MAG: dihydroorotate dehydrogenase electron transfer subunit [Candidatus Helarchaeota archaeon]
MNFIEKPLIVKLINARQETKKIKTLYFNYPLAEVLPGQFFMVWTFFDEIPISVSYIGGKNICGISVKEVGEATRFLNSLSKGDIIGIRGPYGTFFNTIKSGDILIAAGGIGIAPLMPLIQKLISFQSIKITCVLGAKTADEIPFLKELQIIQSKFLKLMICTDDGSMGFTGTVSDKVKDLLIDENFNMVYTCGPELMMKKIFEMTQKKNIPIQASLERIMKCGVGVCGQCVIDPPGLRVCKEGPIFCDEQLKTMGDFGNYKRDFSGCIKKI